MKKSAAILFTLVLALALMLPAACAADRNYLTGEDPSEGAEVEQGWPAAFAKEAEPSADAMADATPSPLETPLPEPEYTDPDIGKTQPFTWGYLATIAGATAATLLIVQFLKVPLDKVWKIPTRVVVYIIALIIMLIATALTTGLTLNNALLAIVNAFVVALAAYGSYEVTFAKLGK